MLRVILGYHFRCDRSVGSWFVDSTVQHYCPGPVSHGQAASAERNADLNIRLSFWNDFYKKVSNARPSLAATLHYLSLVFDVCYSECTVSRYSECTVSR